MFQQQSMHNIPQQKENISSITTPLKSKMDTRMDMTPRSQTKCLPMTQFSAQAWDQNRPNDQNHQILCHQDTKPQNSRQLYDFSQSQTKLQMSGKKLQLPISSATTSMSTCKKDQLYESKQAVAQQFGKAESFKEPKCVNRRIINDVKILQTPESYDRNKLSNSKQSKSNYQYSVRSSLISDSYTTNDNNCAMDRFIPCRMKENLQSKFEAVSQNQQHINFFKRQSSFNQENIAGNSNNAQQVSQLSSAPAISQSESSFSSTEYSNIFGGQQTVDAVIQRELISSQTGERNPQNANANSSSMTFTNDDEPYVPIVNQMSQQSKILQSYNSLLEQQIFFDEDMDGAERCQTNLTTDLANSFQGSATTTQKEIQDFVMKDSQAELNKTNGGALQSKILRFRKSQTGNRNEIQDNKPNSCFNNPLNSGFERSSQGIFEINKVRKIAKDPFRVLDAPNLCDDFYLNLVDWSAKNILAVALGQSVYIWNACTSTVDQLCELPEDDQVTSVAWSQKGQYLSVGTLSGEVQVWDVNHGKQVRGLKGHDHRVGAVSWSGSMIASGSKDKTILVRDVRAQSNFTRRLYGHKQEVCGLRWSHHDEHTLASGGNDNKLMIWSSTQSDPVARFGQHQAAVKAINWSPLHRGLLATGGGTADQCIRFWNTQTLTPINCINTGSQVCNLVFSKTNDELVSTHGYSLNQVIVWKYPTMEKLATLTGHTYRVLYLAMSPDGSSIVTGAGDETLRFWNIFPKSRSSKGASGVVGTGNSALFPSSIDFR